MLVTVFIDEVDGDGMNWSRSLHEFTLVTVFLIWWYHRGVIVPGLVVELFVMASL